MTRLVEALKEVGQTFELFQRGELGPCDSTPSPVQVPNLVPSSYCQVPSAASAIPAEEVLEEEPEVIDPSAPDLQIDPGDPQIDVGAKFALQRMLNSADQYIAADAARLIRAINGGALAGIYGDDLGVVAMEVAPPHGRLGYQLIPEGEDAALVLDVNEPLDALPTIIFRGHQAGDIRSIPTRIDPALQDASQTFALWQRQELGICDSTTWVVPVSNIVPSSYCTSTGILIGTSACATIERPEFLDRFDQGKSDLKLFHKRKIYVIARCVSDRYGAQNAVDLIELIGHASEEGDPGFNETLGQHRAEEVKKELVIALDREMHGLSSQVQIETDTRGPRESRNLGREKDRRVEVFLPQKSISTARDLFVVVTSEGDGFAAAPLEGAAVNLLGSLLSKKLTKYTDMLGQAMFQNLEPGTYEVTARKKGFVKATKEVLHPLEQYQSDSFVFTPTTHSLEGALIPVPLYLQLSKQPGGEKKKTDCLLFMAMNVRGQFRSDCTFEVQIGEEAFTPAQKISDNEWIFVLPTNPRPLPLRIRMKPSSSQYFRAEQEFMFDQSGKLLAKDSRAKTEFCPAAYKIKPGLGPVVLVIAIFSRVRDVTEKALKSLATVPHNRQRNVPGNWPPSKWETPSLVDYHYIADPPLVAKDLKFDRRTIDPDTIDLVLEVKDVVAPKLIAVSWPRSITRTVNSSPTPFLVYFHPTTGQNRDVGIYLDPYPFGFDHIFFGLWRYVNYQGDPLTIDPYPKGLPYQISASGRNVVLVLPLNKPGEEAGVFLSAASMEQILREIQAFVFRRSGVFTPPDLGRTGLGAFSDGNGLTFQFLASRGNQTHRFYLNILKELYMFDTPSQEVNTRMAKGWVDQALNWANKGDSGDKMVRAYTKDDVSNYRRMVDQHPSPPFVKNSPNGLKTAAVLPWPVWRKAVDQVGGNFANPESHQLISAIMLTDALRRSGF